MILRTEAERKMFHLETLVQAVCLLRDTLKEHLSQQDGLPAVCRAPIEMREYWLARIDDCKQHERDLHDQIAEIRIDSAYRQGARDHAPPAAIAAAKPARKPRRRKTVEADYGT